MLGLLTITHMLYCLRNLVVDDEFSDLSGVLVVNETAFNILITPLINIRSSTISILYLYDFTFTSMYLNLNNKIFTANIEPVFMFVTSSLFALYFNSLIFNRYVSNSNNKNSPLHFIQLLITFVKQHS